MRIPVLIPVAKERDLEGWCVPLRAELFCRAAARASAGPLECDVRAFTLDERALVFDVQGVDPERLDPPLFIVDLGGPAGIHRLHSFARQLRIDCCFWGPVHVFSEAEDEPAAADSAFGIWTHNLPPGDFRTVMQTVTSSPRLPRHVRARFVAQAFWRLADQLQTLLDILRNPFPSPRSESYTKYLQSAYTTLELDSSVSSIRALITDIAEVCSRRQVGVEDIRRLLGRVKNAESSPDGDGISTRGRTALHALKNRLLLPDWHPASPDRIQALIGAHTHHLLHRGCLALDPEDARPLLKVLGDLQAVIIQPILDTKCITALTPLAALLHSFTRRLDAKSAPDSLDSPSRIIVVEDDAVWSSRISEILAKFVFSGPVRLQQATNVTQARRLLKADRSPAIVLVDLGLPLRDGSPVKLAAGLALVEEFGDTDSSGRMCPHTFLILTAAETSGAGVQKALELGLPAAAYLRKDSPGLDVELETRLRIAMRPKQAVRIDLFRAAPRCVQVEGHELTLDLPLWSFLTVLAQARRQMWLSPKRVAERLALPPFSLDPETRSDDCSDPVERIVAQLPKYRSELSLKLTQACSRIHGTLPADVVVEFDEDLGYRLNADARIFDTVPYFPADHCPTILIVEDSQDWSQQIEAALQRCGFATRTADSIEVAKRRFTEQRPDLLTLDLELPDDTTQLRAGVIRPDGGLHLLRWIRDFDPALPAVLMTGTSPSDQLMVSLLKGGIRHDDYLFKDDPDPVKRLLASIDRLWRETLTRCRILDWDPTSVAHPITISRRTRVVEGAPPVQYQVLTSVAKYPIKARGLGAVVLEVLSSRPNTFVGREELLETLFQDSDSSQDTQVLGQAGKSAGTSKRAADDEDRDDEKALNQHVKRLRSDITEATQGAIDGKEIICGGRGIYWLRGIVQPEEVAESPI